VAVDLGDGLRPPSGEQSQVHRIDSGDEGVGLLDESVRSAGRQDVPHSHQSGSGLGVFLEFQPVELLQDPGRHANDGVLWVAAGSEGVRRRILDNVTARRWDPGGDGQPLDDVIKIREFLLRHRPGPADGQDDLFAPEKSTGRQRQGVGEALAKSVVRSMGSSLGRQIVRGVLGALFKGR